MNSLSKFIKIIKKISFKRDLGHLLELNKVNKKLDRTTLNLRRTEALSKAISETITDTIVTFDNQGSYSVRESGRHQHVWLPAKGIGGKTRSEAFS